LPGTRLMCVVHLDGGCGRPPDQTAPWSGCLGVPAVAAVWPQAIMETR
jgi:hypothetical protein